MVPNMAKQIAHFWQMARSGGGAPDPQLARTRARTFSESLASAGSGSLLTLRSETGIEHYLVTPGTPNDARIAGNLANVVGAKHTHRDTAPDLSGTDAIAQLVARPTDYVQRDTQAAGDPTELAAAIARNLPIGGWVSVSFRRPAKFERKAVRDWFTHRNGSEMTHYWRSGEAMLARFVAGAPTSAEAESILSTMSASVPGWDIAVKPVTPAGNAPGRLAALAAAAAGPALVKWAMPPLATAANLSVPTPAWWWFALAALPGLTVLALMIAGVIKSPHTRIMDALHDHVLPTPTRRPVPASKPRKERHGEDGKTINARPGGYPLAPSTFWIDPAMLVGIVSPHGVATAVSTTQMRAVPQALRSPIGPVIGYDGDGLPVHLSNADSYSGRGMFGSPGSGKSGQLTGLFAYDVAARVGKLDAPDHPGPNNTIVAFESKGGGMKDYLAWLDTFGSERIVIEVSDPTSVGIDISDPGNGSRDPFDRTATVSDALYALFGDVLYGYRSKEVVDCLLPACFMMVDADARTAGIEPTSWMGYLHVLLTGRGDATAVALANAYIQRAMRSDNVHRETVERLNVWFGASVTAANRRDPLAAPRNKIGMLLGMPHWWSRPKQVPWRKLLTRHVPIIVNTGSPVADVNATVDDTVSSAITTLLMNSLVRAIKLNCQEWFHAGRAVTVYSDELSLLVGESPEVFTWMRNQGRSFGVRCVLATQVPEQLPPAVQSAVIGFGTIYWFKQDDRKVIEQAVLDLTKDGSNWSAADVVGLAPFHAILRTSVRGQAQPAAPIRLAYWGPDKEGKDRRGEFLNDQKSTD